MTRTPFAWLRLIWKKRSPAKGQPQRYPPQVEWLEDRVVPSYFPSTTNGIHIFEDQLPGSLSSTMMQFLATHTDGTQKETLDTTNQFRAINPNFTVLHYQLGTGNSAYDYIINNQWSSDFSYVNQQESWFAHQTYSGEPQSAADLASGRVGNSSGWYQADIANPAWQQYTLNQVLQNMAATGSNGWFADSFTYGIGGAGYDSPIPTRYQGTNAANAADWPGGVTWTTQLGNWAQTVENAFAQYNATNGTDYKFIPNLDARATSWEPNWYDNANGVPFVDGAFLEGFGQYTDTYDWTLSMNRGLNLTENGKIVIMQSYPSASPDTAAGQQQVDFLLGTYLLLKGDQTYLNIFYGGGAQYFPEYQLNLGAATTPLPSNVSSYLWNGVYRRDFQNGFVLVNPGTTTYSLNLGGNYRQVKASGGGTLSDSQIDAKGNYIGGSLTYQNVNSVTLTGGSAAIFLNPRVTYAVTSTADDGSTGTLRDAINQVNAGKYNEIDFNLAGTGVRTINLTSALPAITANSVFINGQSENQFQGVTSTSPLIELNGSSAGSGSDGLLLQGSNDTVSGLLIENFASNGIEVAGTGNTLGGSVAGAGNILSGNSGDGLHIDSGASGTVIQGNFLGITTGNSALANSGNGINVASTNNTIGGTAYWARNYIAGNSKDGILFASTASGNQVLGNYIGISGINTAVSNSNGIEVQGTLNTIGGSAAGSYNVISGNKNDGVLIDSGATGNVVEGNHVGLNLSGNGAVANSIGIEVAGDNNTVGASYAVAPNVISGNSSDGILLDNTSSGNQVLGNYIGTNPAGTAAVANKVGIDDGGSSNTIGGSVLGARNVISGNSGDGVLIDSTATKETMQGNYVGLNVGGNAALANGNDGVEVKGLSNTIGGNSGANYFTRNFISGNGSDGVSIGSGATGNQVLGNFIGVGVSGTNGVGNVTNGVEIASSSNTVGGSTAGLGNVVSGSSNDGLLLDSAAANSLVQGNDVGTDFTGKNAVANGGSGIEIQSTGNTLGGTASSAGNIFSGNSSDGVRIDSTASSNLLLGNRIGLDISNAADANAGNGINLAGSNNTIGGTAYGASNFLSGNSKDGILLSTSASANGVLGNYIGINSADSAVSNNNGVEVQGTLNTIGGSAAGAFNIISGNKNDGVLIDSGATGNVVEGNRVGLNIFGTAAVANSIGIEVAGNNNTVGASYAVAPNVISGNSSDGVLIDSTSSGNQVLGNYIGTNPAGTVALGNKVGIDDGGSSNIIGGSVLGARNIISGNSGDGVLIDSTATKETMQGNYIGTDVTGNTALANGNDGVEVKGLSNTIGGNSGSNWFFRNFISGNGSDGVLIDSSASGNQVQGNFIGVGVSGTKGVGNLANGVEIASSSNTVGGTTAGQGNVISGNSSNGLLLDSAAANNLVQGNDVGTDFSGTNALSNSGTGARITGSNNTLGGSASGAGNIIAYNAVNGVLVSVGAGNTISQNSIFANTGGGISLTDGGNNNLAAPTNLKVSQSGGTLTVTGTFTAPTANVSYVLEFFANPSGDAEGKIYLGSITVKPITTGTQAFAFTAMTTVTGTYPLITATLTDATGDTSAFSGGVTVS